MVRLAQCVAIDVSLMVLDLILKKFVQSYFYFSARFQGQRLKKIKSIKTTNVLRTKENVFDRFSVFMFRGENSSSVAPIGFIDFTCFRVLRNSAERFPIARCLNSRRKISRHKAMSFASVEDSLNDLQFQVTTINMTIHFSQLTFGPLGPSGIQLASTWATWFTDFSQNFSSKTKWNTFSLAGPHKPSAASKQTSYKQFIFIRSDRECWEKKILTIKIFSLQLLTNCVIQYLGANLLVISNRNQENYFLRLHQIILFMQLTIDFSLHFPTAFIANENKMRTADFPFFTLFLRKNLLSTFRVVCMYTTEMNTHRFEYVVTWKHHPKSTLRARNWHFLVGNLNYFMDI